MERAWFGWTPPAEIRGSAASRFGGGRALSREDRESREDETEQGAVSEVNKTEAVGSRNVLFKPQETIMDKRNNKSRVVD